MNKIVSSLVHLASTLESRGLKREAAFTRSILANAQNKQKFTSSYVTPEMIQKLKENVETLRTSTKMIESSYKKNDANIAREHFPAFLAALKNIDELVYEFDSDIKETFRDRRDDDRESMERNPGYVPR